MLKFIENLCWRGLCHAQNLLLFTIEFPIMIKIRLVGIASVLLVGHRCRRTVTGFEPRLPRVDWRAGTFLEQHDLISALRAANRRSPCIANDNICRGRTRGWCLERNRDYGRGCKSEPSPTGHNGFPFLDKSLGPPDCTATGRDELRQQQVEPVLLTTGRWVPPISAARYAIGSNVGAVKRFKGIAAPE
jgi:hypothetical protein